MRSWFYESRPRAGRVKVGFKKFQPIVEWVRDVEATKAREIAVGLHTLSGCTL